jgi:acetyltransferase-like isoleucine patch superfamily enzyme
VGVIDQFTLKMRRGDGWFFSRARKLYKGLMHSNLPLPAPVKGFYRFVYDAHFGIKFAVRWVYNYFYCEPAFRSRCVSVGKNLHLWLLPDVSGHTRIYIGDNVNLYGHMGVGSGRVFDDPTLVIGNRCDIGHNVFFTINKSVVIEDDVNIASNVFILDSDAHPRDPYLRAQKLPPSPDEVKPIRICKHAWIGHGSYIMKGVTVGEGAIVGSNSVVISDVPPFSVVLGNPARVVVKDTRTRADTAAAAPAQAEVVPSPVTR